MQTQIEQGFVLHFAAENHIEEFMQIAANEWQGKGQVRTDVTMRRLGKISVSGDVVDPQLNPIANALIQVTSRQRDFHESVQSDQQGQFSIQGVLPAADYSLKVSSTDSYGIWLKEGVDISAPVNYSVTLPETASGRLVGAIVDRQQLPLANFTLLAMRSGQNGRVVAVKSDDNGFFELNDFVAQNLSFLSRSAPSVRIDGASIAEGDDKQVKLVVNVGTHRVDGTLVTSASGEPVVDSKITLTWQQSFQNLRSSVSHSTRSDAEGRFRFTELGDGDWTLGVNADGFKVVTKSIKPDQQLSPLVISLSNK